jgi:hypothetical protein
MPPPSGLPCVASGPLRAWANALPVMLLARRDERTHRSAAGVLLAIFGMRAVAEYRA